VQTLGCTVCRPADEVVIPVRQEAAPVALQPVQETTSADLPTADDRRSLPRWWPARLACPHHALRVLHACRSSYTARVLTADHASLEDEYVIRQLLSSAPCRSHCQLLRAPCDAGSGLSRAWRHPPPTWRRHPRRPRQRPASHRRCHSQRRCRWWSPCRRWPSRRHRTVRRRSARGRVKQLFTPVDLLLTRFMMLLL